MKPLRTIVAVALTLAVGCLLPAETKNTKEKTPGDVAVEAYFKVRDDKAAEVTVQRLQQVLGAGLAFLTAYPEHARAGSVINSLATFAGTIKDKKLAPLRDYWSSQLKYEVVSRRSKEGATEGAILALSSLDAAVAGYEARVAPSRESVGDFRLKIDQLAELGGSSRFVLGHERDYIQLIVQVNPVAGEAQARKLLAHPDKKIAAMAQEELNILELRKQPLALKFTGFNGKETDVATLRGKPFLLFFWDLSEASLKEIPALDDAFADYAYAFNIVTVCCVPEAQREAVAAMIKAKHIKWPVYFDGKGKENELVGKLNIRTPPACFMFDVNGNLASLSLRAGKVVDEVKRLGKVK